MTAVELLTAEVSTRTRWQVARLRDRDGAVGLGEWSDAGPAADRLWPRIAALLGDGVAPGDLPDELDRLAPAPTSAAERFAQTTVRGALELAAADLAARRAGVPLWRWLGGTGPRAVRRYANLNRALHRRTPEDFATVARAAVAAGYTALKCAPFDRLPIEHRLATGLRLARAVRRAAPSAELMLDVHHHLTLDQLIRSADDLRSLGLRWLEDAVRLDDAPALAAVHAAGIAPLAGGEFATDPDELRPALASGHLAWVLPDLRHSGGLTAARRLVAAARRSGAGVSLHNPAGPVATAAAVHLAVACGTDVETEFAFGESPDRPDATTPPEPADGPWLHPSTAPGLGLDLTPARWTSVPVPPRREPAR